MSPDAPDWLTRALDRLTESAARADEQFAALAAAQVRTDERFARVEEQLAALTAAQVRTEERFARVEEQLAAAQVRTEERFARVEEQLAAAQVRTEERFARVEEQLAAAQVRTEERFARVEEQLAALTAAQVRTEERFARVEEQLAALTAAQVRMEKQLARNTDQIGTLTGWAWEARLRDHAPSFLGQVVRRIHVLTPTELDQALTVATNSGSISEDEADEVSRADLVCRGRDRAGGNVTVVAEVSSRVALRDVDRARVRAQIIAKFAEHALPVVVGQRIDRDARQRAEQVGVQPVIVAPDD